MCIYSFPSPSDSWHRPRLPLSPPFWSFHFTHTHTLINKTYFYITHYGTAPLTPSLLPRRWANYILFSGGNGPIERNVFLCFLLSMKMMRVSDKNHDLPPPSRTEHWMSRESRQTRIATEHRLVDDVGRTSLIYRFFSVNSCFIPLTAVYHYHQPKLNLKN